MTKLESIVISNTEPNSKNVLWYDNKRLLIFSNGHWLPIVDLDDIDVDNLPGVSNLQEALKSLNIKVDNKVDKVTGKGLSTNDYTDADKTKLEKMQEDFAQLRFDLLEKPGLVDRLVAVGYTAASAGSLLDAAGPTGAVRATELREGLYTIGYTTTEMDECMEDVPQLKMADITHAQEIMAAWNPETTRIDGKAVTFKDDPALVVFPKIDTSKVTFIGVQTFASPNLAYLPLLDTSKVTSIPYGGVFQGGSSPKIRRLPAFDFSSINVMEGGFSRNCEYLEYVPDMYFPNAKHLGTLFNGCTRLVNTPRVDWTDKAETVYGMFMNSPGPNPVSEWTDFKCASNISNMFQSMSSTIDWKDYTFTSRAASVALFQFFQNSRIVSFPKFDFKDVGNMEQFIGWCKQLPDSIPDFSKWGGVKNFNQFMCDAPKNVKRVEGLNFASVEQMDVYAFYGCSSLRFIRILNLGKGSCTSYSFSGCSNWGVNDSSNTDARQSLVDTLLTNSYDRAAAGLSTITVSLSSASRNALTNEEKAAITAKGITLS